MRDLADGWDEGTDLRAVRGQALTYLARHNLRAADALQLAAAFLTSEGDPQSLGFICLDRNRADATGREGFRVHSWER